MRTRTRFERSIRVLLFCWSFVATSEPGLLPQFCDLLVVIYRWCSTVFTNGPGKNFGCLELAFPGRISGMRAHLRREGGEGGAGHHDHEHHARHVNPTLQLMDFRLPSKSASSIHLVVRITAKQQGAQERIDRALWYNHAICTLPFAPNTHVHNLHS